MGLHGVVKRGYKKVTVRKLFKKWIKEGLVYQGYNLFGLTDKGVINRDLLLVTMSFDFKDQSPVEGKIVKPRIVRQ